MPSPIWPVPIKAPAAIKNGNAGRGSPICSAKTVAASTSAPCWLRKFMVSFIMDSLNSSEKLLGGVTGNRANSMIVVGTARQAADQS